MEDVAISDTKVPNTKVPTASMSEPKEGTVDKTKEETVSSSKRGDVTPIKEEKKADSGISCIGTIEKLVLASDDSGKKYIQYGFIRCSAKSKLLANQQIFFHMSEVELGSS
jgi:hypothetical protein